MTWRPGAVALVRAVQAAFFVVVAAFCFLAGSAFAYNQFIKPDVFPALTDFVAVSPWMYWALLLLTVLTLMPALRARRVVAVTYLAAAGIVGVVVLVRPPLAAITAKPDYAAAIGIAALVWPAWLAVVDHRIWPAVRVARVDPVRLLIAAAAAALLACVAYGISAPMHVARTIGIDPARTLAAGAGVSLASDLWVFMGVFVAVLVATTLVRRTSGGDASAEFWTIVALFAIAMAVVLYTLVFAAVALTGPAAALCASALALAVAAAWSDLARLRTQTRTEVEAVELFTAPVVGRGSPTVAALLALALPVAAYEVVEALRQFDWNFLLQKVSVLCIWIAAFAVAHALVRVRRRTAPAALLAAVPALAVALYYLSGAMVSAGAIESYAVLDPSFRLIRDAQLAHSSETVEYYSYLRTQTLLAPAQVHQATVSFAPRVPPAARRKPNIFLIVVDSLRRDYLSPYNPRATFTPAIESLSRDSVVFDRAFTRYAGTGLAVPSIWAGGMVPHTGELPTFLRRNPLVQLLDANDYPRALNLDNIVDQLVPHDDSLIQLDRGKRIMDFDLCGTLTELETTMARKREPVFFYSLPQNVHLAVASKRRVPDGESYPPEFYDRIASSVHRVDACVGSFVDELKRRQLYDDSILILTSDHGDSLGEEGRWGHAYYMYPEVMRVPLIVHLPAWMKTDVRADPDAIAFTADITPSLYALLGYHPANLGPLFGRPLFSAAGGEQVSRRDADFLLASSYGAVYGILRHNGRDLYVVDAVDGEDYAFDLTGSGRRVDPTPAMTSENRQLIATQLAALAATYGVTAPR